MDSILRIKKLAKEQKRSLAYLCAQMGVARVYFNDIEKNNRNIPDDKLEIIARELHTTIAYLKGEINEKEPPAAIGEELEEDVIIFHRDGKTQKKRIPAEQMAIFMAMIDAIPDTPKDDI